MRSGSDSTDRYGLFSLTCVVILFLVHRKLFLFLSVKDLENRLSEFEIESERLSRTLETQRLAASEEETALNKKVEEISKGTQKKVSFSRLNLFLFELTWICRFGKVAEIEQLKQRLKQYDDYDEIKRELEIMKVC